MATECAGAVLTRMRPCRAMADCGCVGGVELLLADEPCDGSRSREAAAKAAATECGESPDCGGGDRAGEGVSTCGCDNGDRTLAGLKTPLARVA